MDITINLKKSELIFDVMNETYIVAHAQFARDGKSREAYSVQATEDEKNKLLRSMQGGFASLKAHLAYYLKANDETTADNILMSDDQDEIILTLTVSERFNKAYTQTIAENVHKYICNKMLFDWFAAVQPERAAAYNEISKMCLIEIDASFVKVAPVRPEVHP